MSEPSPTQSPTSKAEIKMDTPTPPTTQAKDQDTSPPPPYSSTPQTSTATSSTPPSQTQTQTQNPPALPPRPSTSTQNPASEAGMAGALATAKEKAVKYFKFLVEHEKKGEMPWTHWYCCNVVEGAECEKENHRFKKKCGKCGHGVCDNCVKGTL